MALVSMLKYSLGFRYMMGQYSIDPLLNTSATVLSPHSSTRRGHARRHSLLSMFVLVLREQEKYGYCIYLKFCDLVLDLWLSSETAQQTRRDDQVHGPRASAQIWHMLLAAQAANCSLGKEPTLTLSKKVARYCSFHYLIPLGPFLPLKSTSQTLEQPSPTWYLQNDRSTASKVV